MSVSQPFINWILCLYFKLHWSCCWALTPDVFRVISLRTSRLHQAGRETSNGKEAAGSNEPCQIHFCVNIANDHHLNKNTRGTRDKKRDTEQYLETKFPQLPSWCLFTSVILSFPPIKDMKRLLIWKQPESTPISLHSWWIYYCQMIVSLPTESRSRHWGPDTRPCQALNFQKREESPAQLKGFEPTHHTALWGNKSPWASLQVAVLYLAMLKQHSSRPNNMMEVCLKTM